MEIKIQVEEVNKIGDKLLTAYVDGRYSCALELWNKESRLSDLTNNNDRVVELHRYENSNITDEKVREALVKSIKAEAKADWKGNPISHTKVVEKVDGKMIITETEIWDNFTRITKKPVSQSDYVTQHNHGLITQSELAAKLDSLKK
tara:strand:- start:105 stop:545 length:441 start_codon:yes stop_codon:yes gene_type:complete